MKRLFSCFLMLAIGSLAAAVPLFAGNFSIIKVGEWGTGYYEDVFVRGNYAYCAAGSGGLDILDISQPSKPLRVGNVDTPGSANAVFAAGNYAYVADYEGGLRVIDVSVPAQPVPVGHGDTSGDARGVYADDAYAYAASAEGGMDIFDISDPARPVLVGNLSTSGYVEGVYVVGNYAYAADYYNGLDIIDISDRSAPSLVGNYDSRGHGRRVVVAGNYAYMASGYKGLEIIDVSSPAVPFIAGRFEKSGYTRDVHVVGNYAAVSVVHGQGTERYGGFYLVDISNPTVPNKIAGQDTLGGGYGVYINGSHAYFADYDYGFLVFDISTPTAPKIVGRSWNTAKWLNGLDVSGNHAYVGDVENGMHVVDVSDPAAPVQVGLYKTQYQVKDVKVKGKYAYLAHWDKGLKVVDVSDPAKPNGVGGAGVPGAAYALYISGDLAYVNADGLSIIDISKPYDPDLLGYDYAYAAHWLGLYVLGNYVYVADFFGQLRIFDASDPYKPDQVGAYKNISPTGVHVRGDYAFVADNDDGLLAVDVSDPVSPRLVGNSSISFTGEAIQVVDNYAYMADREKGLKVFDVSNPFCPVLVGSCEISSGYVHTVVVNGDYVYMTDHYSGRLYILQVTGKSEAPPRIELNRTQLYFAGDASGVSTGKQTVAINNGGGGTLKWTVSSNKNWLLTDPWGGTNGGELTINVITRVLSPGTYTGTVDILSPGAVNSPRTITVALTVYAPGQSTGPFGTFDTPLEGSPVSGGVPFTGWVLDDIGLQSVRLYREETGGLVYIGDAVFVEGARPDVQEAYPGYPMNYKAGWGYMMLTNLLPGGSGIFKIHAVATDVEGNQVTLGTRTITVDNANAVKPFGAIDTPGQGGKVSGDRYVNFGWALTPLPNSIPTDGSTINVWVDGVNLGHPVYNLYREDIAALFPDTGNSRGAVGYFYLDATAYENGVHTIQWTVTDDAGNTDGIGSRYFTVLNPGGSARNSPASVNGFTPALDSGAVGVIKGFNPGAPMEKVYPGENGVIKIQTRELERLVVHFPHNGQPIVNRSPLPIGSSIDPDRGIFRWQPGPGFSGSYRLVFSPGGPTGSQRTINLLINIKPRFPAS
jgi:hypothetical protein